MVALPISTISPTIAAIDDCWEARQETRQQRRLSGGSIGMKCERAIWYKFRWAQMPERFSGRMMRLFDTGHREEPRAFTSLGLVGVVISDRDPVTRRQWEVTALDGHFVGKLDAKAVGFLEAPITEHVLEIKTHNDKSFQQLKKMGLAAAKPEHLAQCQTYMHLTGITRAFYLAKNKNDEELYGERVRYDAAQAAGLMAKAERVLAAARPPARISDDPSYYLCKSFNCPSYGICHGSDFALRNCRTCLHSTPAMGGDALWWCERDGRALSVQDQEAGCGSHLFIPELVPGEQVDVGADGASVSYRLADGSDWIDRRAVA